MPQFAEFFTEAIIGLFRKWSAGEGVTDLAGGVVSLR